MARTQKYAQYDLGDLLGFTEITKIKDSQIWKHMVIPSIANELGPVRQVVGPLVIEHSRPLFAGDEIDRVTNLNNHKLYGGKSGYIRNPYVATVYHTEKGALCIKRDGVKLEVFAFHGDVVLDAPANLVKPKAKPLVGGKAELIYKIGLRDRRYDGTKKANDCSLMEYPYDDYRLNKPLPNRVKSLEVSTYNFKVGTKLGITSGGNKFRQFIEQPYAFVDNPEKFLEYFWKVWTTTVCPGQVGESYPDMARYIAPNLEALARKAKYDFLEGGASYYHVMLWMKNIGYRIRYSEHSQIVDKLRHFFKTASFEGKPLTRSQQSWVCVLQSLPRQYIPDELFVEGAVWPQTCLDHDQTNIWGFKPLHEKAIDKLKLIEQESLD
jgi:hypothetical protein